MRVRACACMCVYACLYECILYVCMYVCMLFVCLFVCVFVCMCGRTCVCSVLHYVEITVVFQKRTLNK